MPCLGAQLPDFLRDRSYSPYSTVHTVHSHPPSYDLCTARYYFKVLHQLLLSTLSIPKMMIIRVQLFTGAIKRFLSIKAKKILESAHWMIKKNPHSSSGSDFFSSSSFSFLMWAVVNENGHKKRETCQIIMKMKQALAHQFYVLLYTWLFPRILRVRPS